MLIAVANSKDISVPVHWLKRKISLYNHTDGSKAEYVRRANEFVDMQSLKKAQCEEK